MVDGIKSVDDMLASAKAAAEAAKAGKSFGQSKVQQMLAGRDEDIVDISPVQKLLQQSGAAAKKESYFESDDFLRLKVQQLQSQLAIYSSLPGLDPNGAVMAGIEQEIKGILTKQAEKIKKVDEEGKAAEEARQKQLDQDKTLAPSPEDMLKRIRGELTGTTTLTKDVQALLDNVGAKVDSSA